MSYNFKGIKRILVIKLRHIGDVLLTAPVFRALKETFPDAEVSALVNKGTDDVLRGNPFIEEIIAYNRAIKEVSIFKRYAQEIKFLREIKTRRFDMTIDLTGGDRGAIVSFISGAHYRIGWGPTKGFIGKRHLYTHLSKPDGRKHMVIQNLDVVSPLGIRTNNLRVDLFIPDDAMSFIKKILKENISKPIIHIHPTSRWLFKCWKDEYMAEVIRWLLGKGVTVIVTSSPDQKEITKVKGILSLLHPLTNRDSTLLDLTGKTTIKQLAAISKVSDLFLGVDSAPMHIASAVGTPVIALFGPSSAYSWGPWDNNNPQDSYQQGNGVYTLGIHTVLQRNWLCVPCGRDGCNGTKISKCLYDIKPEEVIDLLSSRFIKDKLKYK